MNDQNPTLNAASAEALEARFARRVTAALTEGNRKLAPDIGERLKFAREQALLKARQARPAPVFVPELALAGAGAGAGPIGPRRGAGPDTGWGLRLGAILPLIALLAGLFVIQQYESNSQIAAAVDIDTAILGDDLPPDAYGDPGFAEFLKSPSN